MSNPIDATDFDPNCPVDHSQHIFVPRYCEHDGTDVAPEDCYEVNGGDCDCPCRWCGPIPEEVCDNCGLYAEL